jgi:hypothetical protein
VCMAVSLMGWLVGSLLCCSRGPSSDGGDPPGPFRGQGGQGRGTMMQLRQPSAGTAYTLTYHILSSIPAYIHICMHAYMIIPDVSQMEEEIHTYILLAPMHTSTYVIYAHVHAAYSSVCMYVCMCILRYKSGQRMRYAGTSD